MTDCNAAAACTTGCASRSEGNRSSSAIGRIRPLEPGCSACDVKVSSDRAARLPHDLKRRATEHAGDDEADDDVRPRRAAEPDGQRREQDGHVRDDVVLELARLLARDVPNLAAIVHRRKLREVWGDLKMAGHPARMRSLVGRMRCTVEKEWVVMKFASILAAGMLLLLSASGAVAQTDCKKLVPPSPWGPNDQTGATNRVTPAVTKAAA